MRFYILSVDEFELTKVELYNILKDIDLCVITAKDESEALKVLGEGKYDIDAIVWTMNTVDVKSFESIKRIKSKEAFRNIPVVIISKFTDKKHIIRAIEAGAVEYIAKPYDESIVLRKMHRVLGMPVEKSLDIKLDEDIITFNLEEMLSREVKASSRGGYPLSLVMSALVPKSAGTVPHSEMEDFFNLVVRVVKTKLRETDMCFHYGESSMIVLLPFADCDGAAKVEEKIKSAFETNTVISKKNKGFGIATASVTLPDDGKVKEKLLEKLEHRLEECLSGNEENKA